MGNSPVRPPDSWIALRSLTPARIGLGRVGSGLPLAAHPEFQAVHARAMRCWRRWTWMPSLRRLPVVAVRFARCAARRRIGRRSCGSQISGAGCPLSAEDSLSLYLTYQPRLGRIDSERNCISNVHENGMAAEEAAAQALIKLMFKHHISGVALAAKN